MARYEGPFTWNFFGWALVCMGLECFKLVIQLKSPSNNKSLNLTFFSFQVLWMSRFVFSSSTSTFLTFSIKFLHAALSIPLDVKSL